MSVIIRLQNLPWSANSLDIRQYFRGLSIPEGGVHIVGGEMGDAFIAFSTDEDARQAMMLAGGKIKEVQISLMLSSRSEMQKIIEAARQASMSSSLAQLLAPPAVALGVIPQQPQSLPLQQVQHHQFFSKDPRDPRNERKDSSDLSSSSHETAIRRDRRDRSRSRSRDRSSRRDRRDRDRDRRRKSKSRSRSRDRRRRRSRSRSRGRESHIRDKERKDSKEEPRKDAAGAGSEEPGPTLPSLDVPGSSWNVLQTGQIAPNASLLNNFELLRNLASQQGPLIPAGPSSLLLNSMSLDKNEGNSSERFPNKSNSPLLGDYPGQGNFGNRNSADPRLNNQRLFNDGSFQDKFGAGGGRFDVIRGPKPFQNFNSGYPTRNGGKSRFGNFGRGDDGILNRPSGPHQDRSSLSRGLLDYPRNTPPRDSRSQSGHPDRFNNRDDGVDEFGRSIQLRNRKNAASENSYKEDNDFQGNHQNFSAFGNRFTSAQTNQRGPSSMRGRDSWPPNNRSAENYPERRGFRGSFEDSRGGFRSKGRDGYGKFEDELTEKDCCVEIRNLSPQIAYGEVRRTFNNAKLIIKEIKFFDYSQNDKKCRVRFLNSDNKRKAIQLSSKIQIDNKQVHLLEISDKEFEECVDEGVKRPEVKFSDDEEDTALSPKDVYVQIKDLSLNVEDSDIAKLFPNATLDKVILEVCEDGKTKSAFIKFQKAVDAKVALGTPNRTVGDCIVFLTPLPQYVFNDILNKDPAGKSSKGASPEIMEVEVVNPAEESSSNKSNSPTSCILMKNLPFEANDRDICDFFSDVGLVPNKIHLMLDTEGQPSGDAFCEFSHGSQIERACTKNAAHLGKNIVSVTQVPRSEMLEALGLVQGAADAKNPSQPFREDGRGSRNHCVVAVENIPFRAGPLDIINFFGWSYKLSEGDILRRYNERGQPTGDAKICFKTSEDAQRALRFFNNKSLMGRVVRMKIL